MWLVAGVAAVLGGIVVIVAALAEADVTTSPSRVGPVTPHELRNVRFPIVWRGYDPGHVDAMLARAAAALEDAQHYGATGPAEGGALPGFLADTFEDDEGSDDTPDEDLASGEQRDQVPDDASDEDLGSGEELEDAGGDGPGGLDR